jgi:hypothetical protein
MVREDSSPFAVFPVPLIQPSRIFVSEPISRDDPRSMSSRATATSRRARVSLLGDCADGTCLYFMWNAITELNVQFRKVVS